MFELRRNANQTIAPRRKQHALRPRPPVIDSRQKGRCSSKAVAAPVLTVTGLEMEAVCTYTLITCRPATDVCN